MKPSGPFTIRPILAKEHGCQYQTFLVEGYLFGRRVRRKFKSEDEALGDEPAY